MSAFITRAGASVLLSLLLGAAFPAAAETVVRFTPASEPKTLDPVANWLLVTHQHAYMVYDTLFSLDAELKPQPQMVGDYSVSEDGKTYVMTLRKGLAFHDGSPVTTKDVVASINRWAARDTVGQKLVKMGMKVEAVDNTAFRVSLDHPTELLLQGFAKPSAAALFIMREKEARTDPTTPVSEIIGSGPFYFDSKNYKPGASLVYLRNKAYVPRNDPPSFLAGGKVAKVDRVEWLIMPDATTAVSALQVGETDMLDSPPMDLMPVLEATPDLTIRPLGPLGQMAFLRFNFVQPPFDKPELRRAATLLIDQESVMSVVGATEGTYWQECYSFLACGGANENQSEMDWAKKRNIEEAREIIASAGYDGTPVVLIAPGDNEVLKAVATVVEAQLEEGGFKVDTQYSDFASMMARRANDGPPSEGGWNLFPMWAFTYELDNPISNFYLNTDCPGAYAGWFCSQDISKAKEDWAVASTPDEAAAATARLQSLAAKDMPVVLLGKFSSPLAFNNHLKGVLDTPLPVFWNIEK